MPYKRMFETADKNDYIPSNIFACARLQLVYSGHLTEYFSSKIASDVPQFSQLRELQKVFEE